MDRQVFYTDGLFERKNCDGEMFGEERLEDFVNVHAFESADSTAGRFIEELSQWSGRAHGRSFDYDLTLIFVDVLYEITDGQSCTIRKIFPD